MTVLIMTDSGDHTADLVISELVDRDVGVVRFDPGGGPVALDVRLPETVWTGTVADEHRTIDLREATAVLWRWPTPPAGHRGIADSAERSWAAKEDISGLYGVLKTLPVGWINHPDRAAIAASKPGQLATAAAVGLSVPDTIVTNSGDAVRQWARNRNVLFKAFHAAGTDDHHMVAASHVDVSELPSDLGAASTFQEIVVGDNVRVTIVGSHVFAVVITGTDALDWRPVQHQLTFTPCQVPPDVRVRLGEFMRRYGLEYGALDFVVTRDGWVFLENNPTGMYGFVEIQSGLRITAAIADRLCDLAGSGVGGGGTMGK